MIVFRIVAIAAVLPFAAKRPLRAQDADEYAVWAAAIDAELSRDTSTVYILPDSTFAVEAKNPTFEENPRRLWPGIVGDFALVEHFLAQNHYAAVIDPARISPLRVRIARRDEAAADAQGRRWTIELSRVGFDASRTHAIVRVGAVCGGLCGDGVTLLMERAPDGRWTPLRTVQSYAY